VIVEVGAADGVDTRRYARMFPAAQVIAFEPLAGNVAEIRRRTADFSNVSVHGCAIGDVPGRADFWISGGRPPSGETDNWRYSSSLLPPHAHREHHAWCTFEKDSVEVRRLDSFGFAHIDFMHIDVQGAELAVLRGMGDLLGTVRAIWLEVSAVELYKGQPLRVDVERFLREAGFTLAIDAVDAVSGDQLWTRV
jgi:FkbM family methyltransferase